MSNKRSSERFDSLNLLSYECLDAQGKGWKQGMGRTLNVSESGLKLETHEPIETKYAVMLSMGLEDDLVDIKANVVYCNRGSEGMFEAGIEFAEVKQDALVVLKKYISEFKKQYGD